MILFLVAAAWAVLRSLDAARPLVWLAVAGGFAGLAFNTKTLAAAIAFPALGVAVLFGSPTWRTRILRAAVLAGVAAAASLWWVLAVDAIPSTVRPYVGGSKNNTELNLLIGYNGLGRVDGDGQLASGGRLRGIGGAPAASSEGSPASCGCSATPSGRRSGGCCLSRSARPRSRSGPIASDAIVSPRSCSGAPGSGSTRSCSARRRESSTRTTRPRSLPQSARSSASAPSPQCASIRRYPTASFAVAAIVGVTIAVQRLITNRAPNFHAWAQPAMEVVVAVGLVALFATAFVPRMRRWAGVSLLVMIGGFLIAPTAWAWSETTSPVLERHAAAGRSPRRRVRHHVRVGGIRSRRDARGVPAVGGERRAVDLATTSAFTASGLIAQDDLSVMALGGFLGSDPATSSLEGGGTGEARRDPLLLDWGCSRHPVRCGGRRRGRVRSASSRATRCRGALRSRHVRSPSRRPPAAAVAGRVRRRPAFLDR